MDSELRQHDNWERWLEFFAQGIEVSATQALATASTLLAMVTRDRDRIATLGRAAPSALAVHQALQQHPIATSASLVEATSLTPATVNKSLDHLRKLGIVSELTKRQRGRVFSYRRYVKELSAGTEPFRIGPAWVVAESPSVSVQMAISVLISSTRT